MKYVVYFIVMQHRCKAWK